MKRVRLIALLFCISAPVFYLFWLVFVGSFAFHELLIGVIGAVLASIGLIVIDLYYPARFKPTFAELLTLWRMPWYLLSGTSVIALVAAKDFLGVKPAKSLFRLAVFDAGALDDPHDVARRVLAAVYTTITPESVVLGVNTSDQRLLFHQIERSSVSKMTQALGARG